MRDPGGRAHGSVWEGGPDRWSVPAKVKRASVEARRETRKKVRRKAQEGAWELGAGEREIREEAPGVAGTSQLAREGLLARGWPGWVLANVALLS